MKNVKFNFLRLVSIRARLTLFYTLAVFILLVIVALFLYWISLHILYKADYEFLSDEVDTIQYILDNQSIDSVVLKQAIIDSSKESHGSIYRYFIRVIDDSKQLIAETPLMHHVIPFDNEIFNTSSLLNKKRYYWYEKNNINYLLIQAPIHIGQHNAPGIIQIALDISYQHTLIQDKKKLILGLLISTLLALACGFLIARRGLRSLYLLIETVQKITTTSLHQRIDPKSLPIELTQLGSAFNQMLDRIEQSFNRLKQFSGDLSHELRTPINNLIGQTEISLSYASSIEEYRKVMESNLEEFQRISSLMENILFLTRAENPQFELNQTPFHLSDEIKLIIEFYSAMSEEKCITVSVNGNGTILANSVMMRRLISNLLSNSLKYTPIGGNIIFNITKINKKTIQLCVKDNGIGIADEHLPHIFDRFYRIDSSRTTQGTGLGLAMVKSIAELHEASISITSKLNQGTVITLLFHK